ncbi:hypothetical protein C5167_004294, partial [Papaver somniferum]
ISSDSSPYELNNINSSSNFTISAQSQSIVSSSHFTSIQSLSMAATATTATHTTLPAPSCNLPSPATTELSSCLSQPPTTAQIQITIATTRLHSTIFALHSPSLLNSINNSSNITISAQSQSIVSSSHCTSTWSLSMAATDTTATHTTLPAPSCNLPSPATTALSSCLIQPPTAAQIQITIATTRLHSTIFALHSPSLVPPVTMAATPTSSLHILSIPSFPVKFLSIHIFPFSAQLNFITFCHNNQRLRHRFLFSVTFISVLNQHMQLTTTSIFPAPHNIVHQ